MELNEFKPAMPMDDWIDQFGGSTPWSRKDFLSLHTVLPCMCGADHCRGWVAIHCTDTWGFRRHLSELLDAVHESREPSP